ncbi:hypothetical protein VMCG_05170 [Cytospora schulzeri]|uniref:Ribosomal protein S21 n=1 Tax=Cytospora schulzeri TaxID=448051 RepID=A0A423WQQ5_9PEZI|nr:hypothetical protein VMCG_05170 [Valsa malicola]
MSALHRQFSTTRPFLSEAEAAAPPSSSMSEWKKRMDQQKQQQQQQSPRQAGSYATSNMYSSFLSQNSSSSTSPSSAAAPGTTNSALSIPWAQPSRARRSGGGSPASRTDIEKLGIFADLNSAPRPAADDFATAHQHKKESVMDVKLRLRPSIGRTVHCGKGSKVDLARGLQLLNTQVRKNKVSQDLMRQRFHERPGLKRKRLRRERWRARFKDGFKATCGRVRELARQGW